MEKTDNWLSKRSKERYGLVFLLGFAIMMITLIPLIIRGNGIFVYYGDYNAQQIPFYNLANDAVRGGQFGWNWYTDLGTGFISSYSFYLLGSPFFWLTVLLPRWAVTYSMPVLLAVKHGLATLTSYVYIRRFVRGKTTALTGALLYAFSGFQIYNIFFNHFHDVTAFFPLMLIAMEENINNHRKGVFAVTVALMAAINYYFFCGQVVFLILYYLFRMKCPDFHTSWKKFFGLCIEAIIGTAIAGIILVPSFFGVINNPRVDSKMYDTEILLYDDRVTILKVIQTFFMPSDPPAYPILFDTESKWTSIGGYFPLLGMLGVITFMRTHRKHWATRLSYCLIIFAFVPVLNSLFQAANSYYYARWFYMPILIFAMMTARTIDEEGINIKPAIIFSLVVLAAFIVQSLMPSKIIDDETVVLFSVPNDLGYFFITVAIALFSLLIAGYLFDMKKRGKPYEKAMLWTTAVFVIGLVCNTMYYGTFYKNGSDSNYDEHAINAADNVYENVSENNFFRIEISKGCDNYPMFWKLPNIRAFHSVVEPSIIEFYNSIDIKRGESSRPSISQYPLRALFSTKYYYREKKSNMKFASGVAEAVSSTERARIKNTELLMEKLGISDEDAIDPNMVNITEALPGFEYVSENEYYEIYENKLYIPMGIAYDKYISEDKASELEPLQREGALMKALVLSDEQIDRYSDILTESPVTADKEFEEEEYIELCKEKQEKASKSFRFDSYGFESEIELDKPQLVFFSVPYSSGWSAEVNGKPADIEKVDSGLMAVKAESGNNTIVFRYETPGLKYGFIISVSALAALVLYLLICRRFRGKEKEYGTAHTYDYVSQGDAIATEDFYDIVINDSSKASETEKATKEKAENKTSK
ncbi:YfhO family protein [Ruminococcus flavefaciens]|uniref:Uncharacterized membrane protein YfhO n=1 Tax=Ruminococcus flavefaciens TaxID=1265 RepID=A0A1K1Q279_RUMFL|nr:YfhO family protein [Ruminococcus flavefaciens]SFW53999.1 Uncharacterized membrane protein YfhO [Ruminococcus flavefaciens]